MTKPNQYPIVPPPELVGEWAQTSTATSNGAFWRDLAAKAAQWGADQELEACCDWIKSHFQGMQDWSEILREERRPEKPTLQEKVLDILEKHGDLSPEEHDAILTTLKNLPKQL